MAKRLANEDDLKRIERDRKEINDAYDNGFSFEHDSEHNRSIKSSNDLNDFEDKIDKYGFIHKSKLPPQLTEIELKRNNIEKLREIKWRSMIKDWPKHYSPSKQKFSDKLIGRIFKGIPNSMRNAAWFKLLEIETQIKAQSGVYEKMKNFARRYSLELRQIDLDINRTFRNNLAYKKRYCQRQRQLYNVLAAYSVYNTEIGYCQGMSTLTALLLMYLSDEEQTFWALSQLMSNVKYTMHGFYKSGFPKLIRYSDKHEMIIRTFLPKIHKKFTKCNITPLIYTTKWFLQCFIDALPFSLVLRVWDVFLLKGDITMLAMSYCILKMHKKTLLQKEFDMDKINEFLNHKLPSNFLYDDDLVMIKLDECIEKLLRYKFETGPLLEPIPSNELANVPFGDFKDILSKLAESNTKKNSIDEDREEQLRKLAQIRLDNEKQRREERRRRRQEERRLLYENNPSSMAKFLEEGGKGIRNISDNDSDDDDDSVVKDEDSDDDDLNPSKLSEYDDDKCEKESMLSNLTRQSSPQRSINSYDITNNIHRSSNLRSKHSASNSSFTTNQASDYENMSNSQNQNQNTTPTNKSNILKILNDNSDLTPKYNSNSLQASKSSPKHHLTLVNKPASTSTSAIQAQTATSIPSSKSYIQTTASIMSNPQQHSKAYLLTPPHPKSSTNNIATIKSNPDYYTHENKAASPENSRRMPIKIAEYVRSPHGIYTRVNVPPQTSQQNIPQSTSNLMIATGQTSKRTNSLRSSQKSSLNQHLDTLSNSNHTAAVGTGFITPTKQQLHNHSLRIANIQQQQMQKSNYTVIGQGPAKQSVTYQRNSSASSLNQKNSKYKDGNDLIEQYDYI